MLAESTSTEQKPTSFGENMQIARSGGEAAGEARTGVPVITSQDAVQLNSVVTNMIEGSVEMSKDGSATESDTDADKQE